MSARRTRMHAQAEFLAQPGIDVADVTLLMLVNQAMVDLVNEEVGIALHYENVVDGSPEWQVAASIRTGIHEALYGRLKELLSCEERDEHGHWCAGSLFHDSDHWDGSGCNWSGADQ